ncbi:MAG: hypothetical protein CL537_13765 [Alcanivoracaceae bacterium]|nr:hypothetical protein [Alcanivoracaceae bacterium]|tara:strand:- start:108 stop:470 length:363 start_codon:yes stop_codon:yes gene_type:complete
MINSLLDVLTNVLPLKAEKVLWDGDALVISGDGWFFSTLSAWRVSSGGVVQFACWDKNIDKFLDELEGLDVVAVNHQGAIISVDPVFELSDGRMLEIFSTDTVEPWVLRLPNGEVYSGGS